MCSCNQYYKTIVFYDKEYPKQEKQIAESDIFYQIKQYGGDSISLDKWVTNKSYFKYSETIEKIYVKKINDKTYYVFRFMSNKKSDTIIYCVSVDCSTKDRKLMRKYKDQLVK